MRGITDGVRSLFRRESLSVWPVLQPSKHCNWGVIDRNGYSDFFPIKISPKSYLLRENPCEARSWAVFSFWKPIARSELRHTWHQGPGLAGNEWCCFSLNPGQGDRDVGRQAEPCLWAVMLLLCSHRAHLLMCLLIYSVSLKWFSFPGHSEISKTKFTADLESGNSK